MKGSIDAPQQPLMSIEDWTKALCDQEMPIFSNTANTIYASLEDNKKGAMELASIILQDPNLTAKLLKVSNSSYYNPSRQKINTISRAIVILGAKTIRELTLACAFFESILSTANKSRASEEIGSAIHAAVQAKELAITLNDTSPEEVFIATLLHHIGNIAFWCFEHKQGARINELLNSGDCSAAEAEKKVLGFTLHRLSQKLSHSWHLGGLIEDAIAQSDENNPRIQLVRLGHQINQAVKAGEESPALQECLTKLSRLTGHSEKSQAVRIKRNTETAVKIALQFGAHDASRFIASSLPAQPKETTDITLSDKKELQFQILQEISSHISGTINLNILFELVLEGIHRGVGMDRTLFLLLTADKQSLKEKIAFGWHDRSGQKIQIIAEKNQSNLFFQSLKTADSIWATPQQHKGLYDSQIANLIGLHECFVIPIAAEQKTVGIIYCDRAFHQTSLTGDDFNAVNYFAKQANIGLTLYRIRSL